MGCLCVNCFNCLSACVNSSVHAASVKCNVCVCVTVCVSLCVCHLCCVCITVSLCVCITMLIPFFLYIVFFFFNFFFEQRYVDFDDCMLAVCHVHTPHVRRRTLTRSFDILCAGMGFFQWQRSYARVRNHHPRIFYQFFFKKKK